MPIASVPKKILEVIVASLTDAIEAEAGGADRLEVVRNLAAGGLTPDTPLVSEICAGVSIPVRVMVRETDSMSISDERELNQLRNQAAAFGQLPVDGLVLGFVADNLIDTAALTTILSAAPHLPATFHRAFDFLANPIEGIQVLKSIPQVDRILTLGGPGSWGSRIFRLHQWQQLAYPEIKILVGAGIDTDVLTNLSKDPIVEEIHVGRAARQSSESSSPVSRQAVARLKGLSL